MEVLQPAENLRHAERVPVGRHVFLTCGPARARSASLPVGGHEAKRGQKDSLPLALRQTGEGVSDVRSSTHRSNTPRSKQPQGTQVQEQNGALKSIAQKYEEARRYCQMDLSFWTEGHVSGILRGL